MHIFVRFQASYFGWIQLGIMFGTFGLMYCPEHHSTANKLNWSYSFTLGSAVGSMVGSAVGSMVGSVVGAVDR